jgi:hypothetical protein
LQACRSRHLHKLHAGIARPIAIGPPRDRGKADQVLPSMIGFSRRGWKFNGPLRSISGRGSRGQSRISCRGFLRNGLNRAAITACGLIATECYLPMNTRLFYGYRTETDLSGYRCRFSIMSSMADRRILTSQTGYDEALRGTIARPRSIARCRRALKPGREGVESIARRSPAPCASSDNRSCA